MATPDALPQEQLTQRSGAAVSVTHSTLPDAPGETLWASTPPVNNVIETVSEVADDQKDLDAVFERLDKEARKTGSFDLSAEAPAAAPAPADAKKGTK